MEDISSQIKISLLVDVQQAIKSMQELNRELDKLKSFKMNSSISDQINKRFKDAERSISQTVDKINNVKVINPLDKLMTSYSTHIQDLTSQAEGYFRLWKDTGKIEYKNKFDAILPSIQALNTEQTAFNSLLQKSTGNAGLLANTFRQLKHHASFMASGALLAGAIGIPALAVHTMADIEQEMAGMLQTLPELYKDYENHIVNQKALNEVTHQFLGIAEQYGFEVNKLIDAGKLWSRGYKDVGAVMHLTGNSAKLAVADLMDVTLANRAVESTINSFKRQADAVNFSNHIVDSWTNIAHNAQTSATDLAESMMRSAAAANVVGVSFDTASALAATMIKNTGQAGAVVGNSLKAIYSNIHSKKGIADLEAMGIAVYEFDQQGTKHFRNVENVLIDLMVKTQGTKENLEELIQHVSGGRFQWNRAAALFGDYNEFIKNYNLSIQSSGVADKQVMAQLDTIARKAAQVKASLENLLMGTADAGATSYIKSWLDDINHFLKGLQQVPTGVYAVIGSMTKWAVILYTVNTAMKFLSTGLTGLTTVTAANTVALTAESTAANTAAAATGRLAAVTTVATGGLNLLLAGLIAAGTGAALYANGVGEVVSIGDKLKQHNEDMLTVKQQELEMNQKQTEFIGTLGNAYREFQAKLKAVTDDEEKANQVKSSLMATEEELKKIVGEAGWERLKTSKFTIEAFKAEQNTHSQAANSIKTEIEQLKTIQNDFTDKQIDAVEKRIESLEKETEALGIWRKAQLAAYDFYAGLMDKQIAFKKTVFNNMPDFMMGEKSKLAESITEDEAFRESLRTTSREGLRDDIAEAKAELAKLRQEKLQRSIDSYTAAGTIGGSEIDDGKSSGSSKGASSIPPSDLSARTAKDAYKTAQDQIFLSAKLSADQYSIALDQLNTKEELYGQTIRSTIESYGLKQKRIQDLANEERKYTNEAEYLEELIDNQVETNGELQQALGLTIEQWKKMSKEQKAAYKLDRREFLEQLELTKAQTTALNKYREKASEVHKELVKITDELLKQKFAGVYDEDKIRERTLKSIDVDAETQKANLGYNRPMQSFNERAIEYQAELKRYEQYLKYQKQLAQDYKDMKATEIAKLEEQRSEILNEPDSDDKTAKLAENTKYLQSAREGNTTALLQLNAAQEENNLNIAESIQKQKELEDIFYEIRKAWAENVADMIVDGKDAGEVLKDLWKDLAKEAIMNMLKVNQYQSLLAQTSGKGKGKSSSGGLRMTSAGIGAGVTPYADGGIVKKPTLGLIGEAGEEANINLDKLKAGDSRQAALLNYANTQWNKGDTYVPTFRNPELAKASTTDIKIQQSMEHISELQRANELMMQQNQMLMYMMKNGGNSGGNTVVIAPQSDQQVLDVINRNPRAMQGINGRHKSNGFR